MVSAAAYHSHTPGAPAPTSSHLLLPQNPGLRILEVREAFCDEDFDWQLCQQLTAQQVRHANLALLRQHAARSFGGALGAAGGGDTADGGEQPGS